MHKFHVPARFVLFETVSITILDPVRADSENPCRRLRKVSNAFNSHILPTAYVYYFLILLVCECA